MKKSPTVMAMDSSPRRKRLNDGGLSRLFGQFAEPKSQKGNNCAVLSAHALESFRQIDTCLVGQERKQRPVEEALENRWMDVTSPADSRCVPKMLGHPLNSSDDRPFAHRLAVDALELPERERG